MEYDRARAALLRALESQAHSAGKDPEAHLVAVAARFERDTRLLTETTRLLLWKE